MVSGCIMMRAWATSTRARWASPPRTPELRARFAGQPEFVEHFFEFIAEEVREHLAALGFRTLEEAVATPS
ncbi:MAG: glutamate synthase-related protein [Acidimicrobiales bacterium]